MMDVLAIPLKNIFSKRAPKVVNALSKFVNNVAQGFGIKLTRGNDSLVIAIDTSSILLTDWIKSVSRENISSIVSTDLTGQMADDFDAEYDTPPLTPESEDGEYLWQPMTKDEENSTDTQTYYKGYKENAVIAIEDNDGSHKLWWVEKEYTPDGRLKSVSKLKGVTIIGA
jgi:hypothetical protein